MIDATDGSPVWAKRYARATDDIFDIQDDNTKQVVTALRVCLTDGGAGAGQYEHRGLVILHMGQGAASNIMVLGLLQIPPPGGQGRRP